MDYDVFISHASEDKDSFVRALATMLSDRGISVWYDDFTLRLGDSLSESISKGLARSSHGIVIISPHFFAKKWPKRELAALIAREDYADKVILPIWHGVSKEDVLRELPLLADKLAIKSNSGIDAVAEKILEVVGPFRAAESKYKDGLQYERKRKPADAIACYGEALIIDKNHALARAGFERVRGILAGYGLGITLGAVKLFSPSKGYGFIAAEDGLQYFVHISTLEAVGESLSDGDHVAFIGLAGAKNTVISVRNVSKVRS